MKRFFASIVIAIAIICGYLTPAGSKTVTNIATVNGLKLERTIDVKVDGGISGDGTTPNPTTTTPAPQSGVTTPAPKLSETKLAKTGSDIGFVVLVATLIFVFGSFLYLGSRKDD